MPTPPNNRRAIREIKGLRRLIRQTHERIDNGTLDFAVAASLLTRSYNSLSRLLSTDHRISPPVDPAREELNWLEQEFIAAMIEMRKQRELDEAAGIVDYD
jgi:hypothetical protein